MKPLQNLLWAILLCITVVLEGHAQINQWTWVGGNKLADQSGRYGTKGVTSPDNYPGTRWGSIYFSDKNGNCWLFGGTGIDASGNAGLLNDLWKFDGTNWTWVSGSNLANQNGVRTTRGTPHPFNTPGGRQNGAGSVDNNGNIWIFGGEGFFDTTQVFSYYSSSGAALNDLWKFDGTNWTWLKGGNGYTDKEPGGSFYYYGIYGVQGVAAKTNYPGVRKKCISWTDPNGNMWIYGGDGYADSAYYPTGSTGSLSDLWKWDGTNWTWMGGSNSANIAPVYGVKNVPSSLNSPGGRREGSAAWSDKNGNFWLFGGVSYHPTKSFNYANDLWKYDGINWTWVSGSDTGSQFSIYGKLGIAAPDNVPGARRFASGWSDTSGAIWLFGGVSISPLPNGYLNDLWKFDGKNWAWVTGADTVNQIGKFGTKGVASSSNTPGSRWNTLSWSLKNGKQLIFGGAGPYNTNLYPNGNLNDLWSWDGSKWTWLNGIDTFGVNEPGAYGTRGITSPNNLPEARANATTWTDAKGNLWMLGGESLLSASNYFSDLWKFDGSYWTWVHGSNLKNQPAVLGTIGIAAPSNMPGFGTGFPNWTDKNGNQWILSGKNFWKWDGVNWTCMFQDTATASNGTYIYNRTNSAFWTDKQGNFWLMGGHVYEGFQGVNNMGDQWKWDGTSWTNINTITANTKAKYGTLGIADTANFPGARDGMTIWKDTSDNIWMFGGRYGYTVPIRGPIIGGGNNNDLWKWDGKAWTWVNGGPNNTNFGSYGTKGVPSPSNLPTQRYNATGWVGANGNLWLFGGIGKDANNNSIFLNDLWVWDGKYWTWMAGSSNQAETLSMYGTKGIPSTNNSPGGRKQPVSWRDNAGNLWLFGGYSTIYGSVPLTSNSYYGYVNDLWKFNYGYVTATTNTPGISMAHPSLLLLHNPSVLDEFRFVSDQFYKKLQWQVLDEFGRLLQSGELHSIANSAVQTVSTQHFNNGIYFIRFIGDDKKIQTLKWIKL